jgi:carbonic anhydrase
LRHGEAHIIRNAGGAVTDDVIRSLTLSQRMLGTREIVIVQHTKCGLHQLSEDAFKAEVEAETGMRPWWALESFTDPHANVRQSIKRLLHSPFVLHKEHIRGFVYDVDTGLLGEVTT